MKFRASFVLTRSSWIQFVDFEDFEDVCLARRWAGKNTAALFDF